MGKSFLWWVAIGEEIPLCIKCKVQVEGTPMMRHLQGSGIFPRFSCLLLLSAMLSGCGAAAAPCRVASAGIKAIPVVGGIASAPTDACSDVIDP